MGKKRQGKAAKAERKQTQKAPERPWLVPVLVFLGALLVIALALVASADK